MITAMRARLDLVLFALAIVIGSAAALQAELTEGAMTPFVLVSIIAMVLGEQLPMRISRQVIAPLMTAPALGLILTRSAFNGEPPSACTVLAMIWLSILVGGLIARAGGHKVVEGSLGARFLGLAVTTLLARGITVDGRVLIDVAVSDDVRPATAAFVLLLAAVAGGLTQRILEVLVAWLGEGRRLSRILADEGGPLTRISAAILTSGPLIALAYPVIGWVAIPLLVLPVLLAYVAVRRLLAIRRAMGESLLALSRLTAVSGLTRPGHPNRVAELAVAIGEQMDLDSRTLRQIERTALLHDVGQLGLDEPLRDGATLHAGPEVEDRIAVVSTHVVGSSPQLATLVPLLDHVRTPFRRSREFGAHIPLESRIVRVASAWDDITEGARSARVREVALERLHLGLGYDYDPDVVAALEHVT
ncbi:HD-GYP domain-containing protein [Janibacter sp. GS2]|uniref:HD-GYP domain-containing protein n=1 Tax=Janibacter sp. GS2 TaxID=3442646 RepID=UPI003EB8F0FB